ncbi:MAG TPA: hypothetical protein VGD67_09330 [Pseudonocardiaceae bacterium]
MARAEVEAVRDALLPLCGALHEAFARADRTRRERLPELAGDPLYRWHTTHTIRAYAHHALSRADLGPWKLSGNHAHNGELWLTDSVYEVRVLHASADNDVPGPTGRLVYGEVMLPMSPPLFGPSNNRLLVLWRVSDAGAPKFRVVRPVGEWRFGGTQQTDLDFVLPPDAAELRAAVIELADDNLELLLPAEEA